MQQIQDNNYITILKDVQRWRASALSDIGMYDFPNNTFFKIFFHFYNGSDSSVAQPGTKDKKATSAETTYTGLIAPVWELFGNSSWSSIQSDIDMLWDNSTAWSYFVMNDDKIRANNVKSFVNLLSSISSDTPWYFQNISGLGAAIDRQVTSGDFTMKAEREKITIECLEDAYDNRIGTLLDLYRSIVWSWETKREMLPINLRKFDMTIVLFQMPISGQHIPRNMGRFTDTDLRSSKKIVETPAGFAVMYDGVPTSAPVASYKAFEFHGCEIDYNTSKSGYEQIDNKTGTPQKYNIDIYYDDMFETRFNEYMDCYITDLVGDDDVMLEELQQEEKEIPAKFKFIRDNFDINSIKDQLQETQQDQSSISQHKVPIYSEPSPLDVYTPTKDLGTIYHIDRRGSSILDQFLGKYVSKVSTGIKKIYLGNLENLSVSVLDRAMNLATSGDFWGTVDTVKQYTKTDHGIRYNYAGLGHDIKEPIFNEQPVPKTFIELGNIFNSETLANS